MILARVVGDVVATIKHADLAARKLLLVQPVDPGGAAIGRAAIAVDAVRRRHRRSGAGCGRGQLRRLRCCGSHAARCAR